MASVVHLTCNECGKAFSKEKKEYDRWVRKGRERFYCSLSCSITQENKRNPRKGDIANFGDSCQAKKADSLSPFRWFHRRAVARDKFGTNLTPEYLQQLWQAQGGICPLTGWLLVLPYGTEGWNNPKSIDRASLDRIDNSIGYMEGNVRFISVMANYARNTFSDEEVIKFAEAIVSNKISGM